MATRRYATRAVEIDGIDFNQGDIIPMDIYIEDDSDFVRYEGQTPTKAEAKAAHKASRAEKLDAGITSESFAGAEKITTKPAEGDDVKTLFEEDGEDGDADSEDDADKGEKPAVVAEDAKTEQVLKKDDKKK